MSAEQNTPLPAEADRPESSLHTPAPLVEFMATGWIDRPSVAQPHPQAQRFAQRRAALSQANRGTYVVVPAGPERVRANDTFFRFRASSDFAYLVGNGEPGAVLVLEPDGASHRSLLFVLDHNRGTPEFFTDRQVGELWVGRHRGVAESRSYYGVDDCRSLKQLAGYLRRAARREVSAARHARPRRSDRSRLRAQRRRCRTGRASLGDAADQGRVRARRASQGVRHHQARVRGCGASDADRKERTRDRSRVLGPRAHRSQRRRLLDHRGRRRSRVHAALDSQRRPVVARRAASARCRRRMRFALYRRRHAHASDLGTIFARAADDLRSRVGSAARRHRGRCAGQTIFSNPAGARCAYSRKA